MKIKIGPSTFRVHQTNNDPAELIVNGIPIGELYEYQNKDILMEAVENGKQYWKQFGTAKGIFCTCLALAIVFSCGAVSNGFYMHKLKILADTMDRRTT